MASWLTAQKKRDIHDIRDFISVHGKVLKPSCKSHTREGGDRTKDKHTSVLKHMKQSSLKFDKSKNKSKSRRELEPRKSSEFGEQREKVPASKFSTGVRRKVLKDASSTDEHGPSVETHTVSGIDKENDSVLSTTRSSVAHSHGKRTSDSPRTAIKPKRSMTKLTTRRDIRRVPKEKKTLTDESNTVKVDHGVSRPFLSTGKRRVTHQGSQHREETVLRKVLKDASSTDVLPSTRTQTGTCSKTDQSKHVSTCVSHVVEQSSVLGGVLPEAESASNNTPDSDSENDLYIDTDELLAELSNCEKMVV